MEPFTKKRRLAPKVTEKPLHEQIQDQRSFTYPPQPPIPMQDAQPGLPPTDHSDFERFARHLQDAAQLVYNQANRSTYNSVSVLLLRWEDDLSVENDLLALQKLFRERYNYRTESWSIPSCPNPNAKLSMQVAQHIEYARPGHLLIIYYVGYSFVGADNNLYWACNPREDSSKLKWEGVRSLIEDAPSDILLLLDCCAVADVPAAGSNGVKQVVAAYGPESAGSGPEPGARTFTYHLIEALHKLSEGPPFPISHLHEEVVIQKQQHKLSLEHSNLANGSGKPTPPLERIPITFSLTPNTLQTITLTPLPPQSLPGQLGSPLGSPDGALHHPANGTSPSNIVFEDLRALLSINFSGEPSYELAAFKSWLNSTPATAAKVTVEGMFQGPQTMMIISMPVSVYNAISADRSYLFLGYVKSHNLLREYQKLVDVTTVNSNTSTKHLEDGEILLEAAKAAASSPAIVRHNPHALPPPDMGHHIPYSPSQGIPPPPPLMADGSILPDRKDEHEDSDEMHEAAIQLKALSHVRPVSHDSHGNDRGASQLPQDDSALLHSPHDETMSSPDGGDSLVDDTMYSSEFNSPATRPKARRSIQKQGPKQDTRCSMCSHAPFKDSSSLRKHVAAAHTRPFPCAFSFAGCTSTFGSKNEWKRHIASQHLCLTYYRCSSCPQSTVEGKGNEFNRKDLFTQHLRRMHAPFAIKKAIAKGDSKLQLEWETHVKEMQASCLVVRRSPPQRSACPKPDCSNIFEGAGSWDDWTEHVGRHMEKGEASRLGVDRLLARWALDEGIIERKEDGEYRLCGQEREGGGSAGGYYSDGGGNGNGNGASNGNGAGVKQQPSPLPPSLVKDETERLLEESLLAAD